MPATTLGRLVGESLAPGEEKEIIDRDSLILWIRQSGWLCSKMYNMQMFLDDPVTGWKHLCNLDARGK